MDKYLLGEVPVEEAGTLTLSNPTKKAELQVPLVEGAGTVPLVVLVEGAGTALLVPLVGVVLVEGAGTVPLVPLVGVVLVEGAGTVLLVPLVGLVLVEGAGTVLLVVPVEEAETVNIVDPPWGEVVQEAEVPWTAQNAEWGA